MTDPTSLPRYAHRRHAGLVLARHLIRYRFSDALVLAVPRGGVPVAWEVARALHLPLDLLLIKKLGHPANKEFAVGAVSLSEEIITVDSPPFTAGYLQKEATRLRRRLVEMNHLFRQDSPPADLRGKTLLLVDDGIATGFTLHAGIRLLRAAAPARIVVAVPVASVSAITLLRLLSDELVCPFIPDTFHGVGQFYQDFTQVSDSEVIRYLQPVIS